MAPSRASCARWASNSRKAPNYWCWRRRTSAREREHRVFDVRLLAGREQRPESAAGIHERDDVVVGVQAQRLFHLGIVGRFAGLPGRGVTEVVQSQQDVLRG